MGTLVPLTENDIKGINEMFNTFAEYSHCHFTVRIDKDLVQGDLPNNIEVRDEKTEFIDQQGILGVPQICIPYHSEQEYTAAILENLGIGIWVNRDNLANEISQAIFKILPHPQYFNLFGSKYSKYAWNIREMISNDVHQYSQKDKLLDIVARVIQN
uniref:Glucuronosyltransferase n=1 Tax=Meloidogyne hapla TaxID=6305 RepID=A0A1I8B8G0_MELHA